MLHALVLSKPIRLMNKHLKQSALIAKYRMKSERRFQTVELASEKSGWHLRFVSRFWCYINMYVCMNEYHVSQATRYASQHIWCLSQARINWEGCERMRKNGGDGRGGGTN